MRKSVIPLLLSSIFWTGSALANDNGTAFIAFAGQANSDSACAGVDGLPDASCDDSGSLYGIGLAFRNQHIGFEGTWLQLGKFDFSAQNVEGDADLSAFNLGAAAFLNAGRQKFDAYVKGGLSVWQSDVGATVNGTSGSDDSDGATFYFGAGVQFIVGGTTLFAEYMQISDVELVPDEEDGLSLINLGARFHF